MGNSISVLLNYVKTSGFDSAVSKYQQLFDDYAEVESEYSNIVMGESRLGKRRVRHYIVNFGAE